MVYNDTKHKREVLTFRISGELDVLTMEDKECKEQSVEEALYTDIDALLDEWMQESPTSLEEHVEAEPEQVMEPKTVRRNKESWQGTVLMYLHDLVYLLAGLILVFLLLFRVVVVSGTSMNGTLMDGDYLLLLSSAFYKEPQQGDIVVASKFSFQDGEPIVKRVIATEGQWVRIDKETNLVYVGDTKDTMQPLDEPYILGITFPRDMGDEPTVVPEGCIFVLGDNRGVSLDSRSAEIGFIDKREVLGKVFFLFLPGTNHGQVTQDYGRIGVVD